MTTATFPSRSFAATAPAKKLARPAAASTRATAGPYAWLPVAVRRNLSARALRLMRSGD